MPNDKPRPNLDDITDLSEFASYFEWVYEEVRWLDDEFRRTGTGGIVLLSRGIIALGADAILEIITAVQTFDAFTRENDPHNTHDSGQLTVAGVNVTWKIEHYDKTRRQPSPDAANPAVTVRALLIMLDDED